MEKTAFLISSAFEIQDQINFFWNFYVGSSAILLGWVLTANITWEMPKRLIVMVLFLMFAFVNCRALSNAYTLLGHIVADLEAIRDPAVNNLLLYQNFSISKGIGGRASCLVHIIADAIILFFIYAETAHKQKMQLQK